MTPAILSDNVNWLGIDTALNACGVIVKRADGAIFERTEEMARGQAERLLPLMLEVCSEAGIALQQVDAFACINGPGTFTGLRVGLSTIRALAQTSGRPAIGVGTFDVVEDMFAERPLCTLIETKRRDYYMRAPNQSDGCITPEDLKAIIEPDWVLAGDAVARAVAECDLANLTHPITALSLPVFIARAQRTPANGLPEPQYLRNADVSTTRLIPAKII